MTTSNHAYIVGMTDKVRNELIGSLQQTGYRVSPVDAQLRALAPGGRGHNRPDAIVIDVADMTPVAAEGMRETPEGSQGAKVVLMSRRASLALDGKDLPPGIWGLVPRTASARSLRDLVGFLAGRHQTVH
jgi:hypothetical protein